MTDQKLQPIYLCTECKSIHSSLDEMFFVEERTSKGFCSEACIEKFYRPLLDYYENLENEFRKELKIEDETVLFGTSDEEMMSKLIHQPDEVYKMTNPLGEELFFYIKSMNRGFFAVLCTSFKNEPSYIYLTIKTTSHDLLNKFKIGEKIVLENQFQSHHLDEIIESKKSEFLAQLLTFGHKLDIQIESFYQYDHFFEPTLNDPDEVFEFKDSMGDTMLSYLKTYEHEKQAIIFIVLCLKYDSRYLDPEQNENQMTIFPVLGFPTINSEIYSKFRTGKRLSGKTPN